jgi:hypothetical protein
MFIGNCHRRLFEITMQIGLEAVIFDEKKCDFDHKSNMQMFSIFSNKINLNPVDNIMYIVFNDTAIKYYVQQRAGIFY